MKTILLLTMLFVTSLTYSQFRNPNDSIVEFYKVKKLFRPLYNVKKYTKYKSPEDKLKSDYKELKTIETNYVINAVLNKMTNDLRKKSGLLPVADQTLFTSNAEESNKEAAGEILYDFNLDEFILRMSLSNPNCDCAAQIFYYMTQDFEMLDGPNKGKKFSIKEVMLDPNIEEISVTYFKIYKQNKFISSHVVIQSKRSGLFKTENYFLELEQ